MSTLNSSLPYRAPADDVADGPSLLQRAGDAWRRWWFAPESAVNLGICRLLFFGLEFANFVGKDFASWATLPQSFVRPVWLFERLHLPILPYGAVYVLQVTWYVTLFTACIGLFTRASTLVAAACGVYLFGLTYCYGKVDHMTAMMLFATGIMALSRCGDAVSVDALVRRWRGRPAPPPSGEYRWPVRMVWVLMAVIFFNAGMAKVIRGPAVPWVFSDNFAIVLTQRHYMTSTPALDWGLWIAAHPWAYMSAAAGAILGEVFLFVALFDRRLRAVIPWGLLMMQVGIGLLMRVWFTPYMIVYLFWVPWGTVAAWVGRKLGAAPRAG